VGGLRTYRLLKFVLDFRTGFRLTERNCERSGSDFANTVEPGFNDIGLYDTSHIASDIVVPLYSLFLTVTFFFHVAPFDPFSGHGCPRSWGVTITLSQTHHSR
jgi:hypothetical protein